MPPDGPTPDTFTEQPPAWRGAVFAGGNSSRMGRDKALLEFKGVPLWRRQRQVLLDAGFSDVVVVRRPDQPAVDAGIPHVRDRTPGAGPLAGLEAALLAGMGYLAPITEEKAGAGFFLGVLAVDMPAVDADWFRWLRAACRPGCGAVALHADGFEPLAAIYPSEALPLVERHLARKDFSLQLLLNALVVADRMAVLPLPEERRAKVASWNSPSDVLWESPPAAVSPAR